MHRKFIFFLIDNKIKQGNELIPILTIIVFSAILIINALILQQMHKQKIVII